MIFWLGTPSDEARALVDYMKWSEGRPNHGQPFADVYESDLLEQSLVSQLRFAFISFFTNRFRGK